MERLHSEQDVRKSVIVCEGVLPLPDATYLLRKVYNIAPSPAAPKNSFAGYEQV